MPVAPVAPVARGRRSPDRSGTPNRPKRARQRCALTAHTSTSRRLRVRSRARLATHLWSSPRRARARATSIHTGPALTRVVRPHDRGLLLISERGPALSRTAGPPPHLERGPSLAPIAVSPPPRGRARAPRGACAVRAAWRARCAREGTKKKQKIAARRVPTWSPTVVLTPPERA